MLSNLIKNFIKFINYLKIPRHVPDSNFIFLDWRKAVDKESGTLKLRNNICFFEAVNGAGLNRGTSHNAFKAELP